VVKNAERREEMKIREERRGEKKREKRREESETLA
jgi:hypothetical protein